MLLEEPGRHVVLGLDVHILRRDGRAGGLLAALHAEEGLDALHL